MTRARSLWVPVLLAVVAASGLGTSAESKRGIVMEIKPTSLTGRHPQLTGQEGNPVTIEMKDQWKFGFVPTVRADDDSRVVVEIFDMRAEPNRHLSQVEAVVGGDAVESETTPPFSVRVLRVIPAK